MTYIIFTHFELAIKQNGILLIWVFYKLGLKMFNEFKALLRRSRVIWGRSEAIFYFVSNKEIAEK